LRQLSLITLVLVIAACSYVKTKLEEKDVVARVHDKHLYYTDLEGIIPDGTSYEDSITLTNSFIDNWIRQKLVIHKAEQNLSKNQKIVDKQLESYRNSLIVFTYEKELIRQKLDTSVSNQEIKAYYDNNQKNFELKENIIKFEYLKLSTKSPKLNKVQNWFRYGTKEKKEKLKEYCYQYAINFSLEDTSWYFLDEISQEIPFDEYHKNRIINNRKFFEISDSSSVYLIKINDVRIKDSISPLAMQKSNIKSIIINKRKLKLIKDMQQNVYNSALKNNEFEIYL